MNSTKIKSLILSEANKNNRKYEDKNNINHKENNVNENINSFLKEGIKDKKFDEKAEDVKDGNSILNKISIFSLNNDRVNKSSNNTVYDKNLNMKNHIIDENISRSNYSSTVNSINKSNISNNKIIEMNESNKNKINNDSLNNAFNSLNINNKNTNSNNINKNYGENNSPFNRESNESNNSDSSLTTFTILDSQNINITDSNSFSNLTFDTFCEAFIISGAALHNPTTILESEKFPSFCCHEMCSSFEAYKPQIIYRYPLKDTKQIELTSLVNNFK